jgi:hypothetical protein
MSNKLVDLEVRISADVAGDVAGTFDDIGAGAKRMADDVGSSTSAASGHIDKLGGAAEGLDDKFGRAAGAAGALSSGADLIGNEKASAALQAMALATDFFSGVGQVGILVTEGLSAATVENEAATVSQTIATKAAAIGTKAWAIAQGALNAVMDANPIALVVLAVVALVAGIVLAYKHSETFRNIVQAAMRAAGAAVGKVVDVIGDIVDWVKKGGDAFGVFGDVVKFYVFLIKTEIRLIVDVIEFVVGKVGDLSHVFGQVKDDIVGAAKAVEDKAGAAFRHLLAPIQAVKDLIDDVIGQVKDLIDWISKIHFPHVPDINPFGRTSTGGRPGSIESAGTTVNVQLGPITINIPVSDLGTTTPAALAATIIDALKRYADGLGITVADALASGRV